MDSRAALKEMKTLWFVSHLHDNENYPAFWIILILMMPRTTLCALLTKQRFHCKALTRGNSTKCIIAHMCMQFTVLPLEAGHSDL